MLKPYDGASRVQLPDGRGCWEKETKHYGYNELTLSYEYSVGIKKGTPLDYWGRVIGIEVQDKDGKYYEPVNFMPVTDDAIAKLRRACQDAWAEHSEWSPTNSVGERQRLMVAGGYLRAMEQVMKLLKGYRKQWEER